MAILDSGLFVFDWSGVISDDRLPVYEANMALLVHFGKPTMTFEQWLPQTQLTAEAFLKSQGVEVDSDEAYRLYKQEYGKAIERGVLPHVYPDAPGTLEFLQREGKRLAVLSSHPEENLRREAAQYGLEAFFERFQWDGKDKRRGLIDTCKDMTTIRRNAIYLGDTVYDIRAATEAGIRVIGVANGYHTRDRLASALPDYIIDNLSEMIPARSLP